MKTRASVVLALFVLLPAALAQEWPQWALDPQHTGQVSIAGQNLNQNIVNLVYDPLVPQEMATAAQLFGDQDLLAHFQAPLVDGGDVYMMFKSGNFNPNSYAAQTWGETKYSWSGNTLVTVWQFTTDWKAPGSLKYDFWEPVFHPALANGALYVPGAGGSIWKVNKTTGTGTRLNPFSGVDNNTYTAGPISVDGSGNLYYNVVQLQPGGPSFYSKDSVDSWLVRVTPGDAISKISYYTLVPDAPAASAPCEHTFEVAAPWPPSPTSVPPTAPCGPVRAALNIAPAIAPNGTIYTVARSHGALSNRYGWLVAVKPNMTRKWDTSMRNRFTDGCGVPVSQGGSLPPNGTPGGCTAGATLGVDPGVNHFGDGRVLDDSSSTPVVGPDGSIYYGAYSRYNYAQGHLMKFSSNGNYVGAYRFGWDVTPGIYSHDGTYSVVTKDNQYGEVGSYCNDPVVCPEDRTASNPAYPEAYFVTQLTKNLGVEWRFQNTNTQSCSRDANGNVTCTETNPFGFEWCVNAFIVDSLGVVYANSEDGNLFAINQGGTLRDKIFQQLALGAAYTPTSIGSDGRIYSQNAGHLFVAGN
jgi:hypothetical protein